MSEFNKRINTCNDYLNKLGNKNQSEKETLLKEKEIIEKNKNNLLKSMICNRPKTLKDEDTAEGIKLFLIIFGSIGGAILLVLFIFFIKNKFFNKKSKK